MERGLDPAGTGTARRLTDKVTALEVEAVQLVARLLRIHDVFIDDEGSALCVAGNALADLAAGDVSIEADRISGVPRTGWARTCRRARRAPPVSRCSCKYLSAPMCPDKEMGRGADNEP